MSGAVTSQQRGAVECGNPCTLVNMNIHDNPDAFAGIYALPNGASGPFVVSGGRVTGSGSLGIGSSNSGQVTISGVEIDHNGASANCGFEGGGFKSTSSGSRFTNNYVHDNNCVGVWYDINAANNEIDHNRVDNNAEGGIFYEISYMTPQSIHDNAIKRQWGRLLHLALGCWDRHRQQLQCPGLQQHPDQQLQRHWRDPAELRSRTIGGRARGARICSRTPASPATVSAGRKDWRGGGQRLPSCRPAT